jgi:6-hydroxycyclohex-1-ene-1-carbonyl-CoA dehydrogenase
MIPSTIKTWQMTEPGKLMRTEIPCRRSAGRSPRRDRGCGVCHTDLSYFYMGVPTDPEAAAVAGPRDFRRGRRRRGRHDRQGSHHPRRAPCNNCEICKTGPRQPLPRPEDAGQLDGHLRRLLQPHPGAGQGPLRRRQPRQHPARASVGDRRRRDHALPGGKRANLQQGDRVIVIGAAGGVGSFMTQTAKGMGARW